MPEALAQVPGIGFDLMRTSFFLSRRALSFRSGGLARLLDQIFAFQMRNAARAADVFGLPPSRVVELGAQVVL